MKLLKKGINSRIPFLSALVLVILSSTLLSDGRAQTTEYHEAPQLAELVAAGQLPPINERLPESPMVVPVIERIGEYGGTWRHTHVGGLLLSLQSYLGYENLVRWTPDWEGVMPNVAEAIDINEEASEFTFHLREGMKWSDGHPFTADDIMFWYEDVFMNDELTPSRGGPLVVDGTPVVVEKVDDYTVTFKFAAPNGFFLYYVAYPAMVTGPTSTPRHYLEQFHAKYNSENIAQLVEEAGLADWVALFQTKSGMLDLTDFFRTSEIPVLHAWHLTTAMGEGGSTRGIAERNPYYWKVDPEGNQLPYIDRHTIDMVTDVEVSLLRALSGEVDFAREGFATVANRPVIMDNMERGNYRLFTEFSDYPNEAVIMFNMNHRDPVKREIFQNKDFRIGMSHAINRQEIIDLLYVGQGEPHQAAPRPESEFYNERLAKQYTEYDVDLANEYLDRAGYTERDVEGFRLGPDGKRIEIVFEIDAVMTNFIDMFALLQGYWEDVGIRTHIRTSDRSLWQVRVKENAEQDATIHTFGGGLGLTVLLDPRYWFPFNFNSMYAQAWAHWYSLPGTGGAVGVTPEEPPEEVQRQMALFREITRSGDPDTQTELLREILDIAADQFYHIGISTKLNGYGIVKNNFRNVPDEMPGSWTYPTPGPVNPSQFFIEGASR